MQLDNRRPIAARSSRFAQGCAAWLASHGVSANAISLASLGFALGAAAALLAGALFSPTWFLVAAALVPLRLFANLLDGLVAIEGGRATALGPLYNEVPDRLSDVAILAAAGHAAALAGPYDWAIAVGWGAAAAALFTAYIRELGRALGLAADFSGPFAKQQRMWVVIIACLLAWAEPLWDAAGLSLTIAVAIIAAGTVLTGFRRLGRLARALKASTAREWT